MKLNLPYNLSKLKSKNINDFNYKINIDTIVLRAKLTDEQIDYIFDHFYYHYKRTKKYRYNLFLKQYGISIQISPIEPTLHAHFNTTITLTPAFFNLNYIPHSIVDVLKTLPFSITRLDIATDFPYQYANNVLHLKNHGNQKDFIYRNESKYVGSKASRFKAISYDRNKKEQAKNSNIVHAFTFNNRLETRLRFKMNEQPINAINHDLIEQQLAKVIYIPSITALKLDGWSKNSLLKIHDNYDLFKALKQNDKKNLKQYLQLNRAPLDAIYSANIDTIYQFLTYREYEQQSQKIIKKAI